ncbi:MAG: DUF11 domain-containing protein [Pseudomonadales bacterium]|nr:DUF11 domain-containing protein [Pseudomonadales bacterium]
MSPSVFNGYFSARRLKRLAGCLLAVIFLSFIAIPDAEATCPGTFPTGDPVELVECSEAASGDSNVNNITVNVPNFASVAANDYLITVVSVANNETFNTVAGWSLLAVQNNGTNVDVAIYTRVSDGAEPVSYNFTWGSNEEVYAFMMHFTGTSGVESFSQQNTNSLTPTSPAVTTTIADTVVLRVAGFDDDDITIDLSPVIAGHTDITQDESSSTGGNSSAAGAYVSQAGVGSSGTDNFTLTVAEQAVAFTMALPPGIPPFSCSGLDGSITGSQLVVLKECTRFQGSTNATPINLPAPTTGVEGDFMVAVINTDANELPFNTVPAGWNVIVQSEGGGATQAIYGKLYTSSEPATYDWVLNSAEQRYAYLLLFDGASGVTIPGSPTVNTGTSASPLSPAVTTAVEGTLILRFATSDDDVPVNPFTIISGYNNITSDSSSQAAAAVSGQAVYLSEPTITTVAAETFTINVADEFWRSTAIGVEPIEFLFAHDGSLSLCAIEEVTISAVDSSGTVLTGFTGTVNLSTSDIVGSPAGNGDWAVGTTGDPAQGTLDNGASDDGIATYTFVAADNGSVTIEFTTDTVGTMSFDLQYSPDARVFTETQSVANDPQLVIDNNCEFRIQHDEAAGTCGMEPITITLVDSAGNQAENYTGTIDVTLDLGAGGNFSVNTGSGTLVPDPDNDDNGDVDYSFVLGDVGQVVLAYTNTTAQTVNFDVEDAANGYVTDTDDPANYDANLVIDDCEIRLIHDGTSDVCSLHPITIRVTDSAGNPILDYSGTITVTNSAFAGTWTVNTATNVLTDNGGGSVDYTFDDLDDGEIILDFQLMQTNAAVDFDVTSTTPGIASPAPPFDDPLAVTTCTAQISVAATMNVCSQSETVTLTILDSGGGAANGAIGTLVLTTDTGNGDYISTTGAGTLDNGAADDGIATYLFDASDGNSVDFEFSTSTVETLNFDASSTYITFDAPGSSDNLDVLGCEFQISHSGTSDVCSIEAITIEVRNSSDVLVTDYVGTVNLSTSTGNGTWTLNTGGGAVVDPVAEDGSATYNFVGGDGGVVVLDFADATNETVNINVSDGTTTDSNPGEDPNLAVDLCTFQITMADETMSACTSEAITIEIFDSSGVSNPANYTGTVTITTDTLNGNWALQAGSGTLTDSVPDDGFATYEFVAGETSITLTFTNATVEDVNVDLVDGVIIEDSGFDPTLEITGCIPALVNSICFPGTGPGTGNLTISGSDPGRMVVMIIWHIDGTPQDVTNATFDGVNMTQIEEITGGNTSIEMWGILDVNLPGAGGPYAGAYTFDAAPANNPSMCMVELADVEQFFPGPDLGTPSQGQVNSNTFAADGAPLELTTSITTTANNAFVLTAGLSDNDNGGGNSWFSDVDPDPSMTMLFTGNNDQNPISGTGAGSTGSKSVAGLISVTDEDPQDAATEGAHIVASFNPRVAGDPEADDFEPVLLFETLSGNISYRAIGNTLRSHSNSGTDDVAPFTAGGSCSIVPVGTGSSATLTMPAGSTVERAYVYWAASGDDALGHTDADVNFGPTGSEIAITADETFLINNVAGGRDFFAGYKNVTSQVSANGSYTLFNLTVQNGAPWNTNNTCAGGWSLIVVYSNPDERFRVTNLFHGFQPFQNSAFTLVLRNFRMQTTDDDPLGFLPNGQITHVTIEGDETLATGDESLGIQDGPGLETFTTLSNSFNPLTADFNSTASLPIFALDGGTGFYEFQSTAGVNGDGYEVFFAPGTPSIPEELGNTWGFDVDTHYISGHTAGTVLYPFAQADAEAEEITIRYSLGQDLVMLISEVISITNFDLADLEVTKATGGTFKVNDTSSYTFTVTNNGNGGISGGEATGQVVVADVFPSGITLSSMSGTDWSCTTSANAFYCVFDIAVDCDIIDGCAIPGELSTGESLPLLTANVNIGDTTFFPLLSNNVKNVGRMQHNGGSCPAAVAGVIADPDDCDRSPQFDNVNDLQGGAIDINDLDDKTSENNNVDSIIHEVRGVETDLGITKVVDGILEVGQPASYTITVTNFGPDDTTGGAGGTITVTDSEPAGITFDSVSGTGWTCPGAAFPCTYGAALPSGNSAILTLNVTVTGSAGENVTNTAAVSSGTFNFDSNSSNDADTDITAIVAPPVAFNERFLISVSVPGDSTDIGGLVGFQNHDYIDYDPLTDTGLMFYDNSGEGYSVADAVHLFKNGHIAVSAAGSSTIGSNVLAFEPEDIVVWDPILETATMLFDGSAIFDGPIGTDENIDAVYVKENGRIIFSTEGPASITWTGPTTLNFNEGDIVEYNPGDGTATILVDSSDPDIFNGEVQVDSIYIRVDDTDPDANKDVFILSINEVSDTIGACGGCDPVGGTVLTRDDIVELDITGANPITQNLFVGDIPLGVFEPTDPLRELDALHVVEDAYLGHFAITQSQAGSTCEAGQITITKHRGLSHDPETSYEGSILITTDITEGDWSISVGSGTLVNGAPDDGAALYTFVPADNGEVTLYLAEDTVSTINVDVTNEFTSELGTEDPNFVFSDVITSVTYRDEWGSVAYTNNDGSTFWDSDWIEFDGLGGGANSGNISAPSGQLEMTSTGGDPTPSVSRTFDLSLYSVTETVFLNYDYSHEFLNAGSDVLVIEAKENAGAGYTTVRTFSGIGGTDLTPNSESLDLSALLPGSPPAWGAGAEVRFSITGGYTGTSRMFFDNIEIATGTTDCGIGAVDHYRIAIDDPNNSGDSLTIYPGIACVGSVIYITGHDASHFPSASGEAISLSTSTGKGDWTLLSGGGAFSNGTLGDGIATYTFPPAEQAVTLYFNYTNPSTDPETVNINIGAAFGVDVNEDPTLEVNDAGLLFFNESDNGPTSTDPIPTQIAGKPSNIAPDIKLITIEGVQTSDNNPLACTPLFDAGNTLDIGFAAECLDPATCSTAPDSDFTINGNVMTPAPNNSGPGTTASYTDLSILMVDQGGGRVGGELVFNYVDVGEMEMHAQYEIPLANDISGTPSTDFMQGSSLPFVVRPFGFDIDFSGDREANGHVDLATSYAGDATDANNFHATAGVGFDTTVSAIVWEAADDSDFDGIPDQGANLYDNAVTMNYGNESTAGTYEVLITHALVEPIGGEDGVLTDTRFPTFSSGAQTHTMTYDEVGVINLDAQLVLNGTSTAANYLGTTFGLQGNVENLGRFVPADFQMSAGVINSRPLATAEPFSIGASTFTYMGEEFEIMATVTARNAAGATTRNYIFDALPGRDFAKLTGTDFDISSFFAADEIGSPTDYSTRLADPTTGPTRSVSWASLADAVMDRGIATLSGNLVFERQASGLEDGPFDTSLLPLPGAGARDSLSIAVNASDSDSVGFVLDLDIDGGGNDAAKISEEEFRYGRLLVDNAFGSESEELAIGFSIEYWDGTEFVLNTDDSSTTLFYDATGADSFDRSLRFLEDPPFPGAYDGTLVPDNDNGMVEVGETFIELEAINDPSDVTISFFEGRTLQISGVDIDTDGVEDDRPFFASAPDPDNTDDINGSAVIEFDLSDAQLPFSLDFLSYDWRGVGDLEDENEDGDYTDNPRARINFGSYPGHDRVINWQEIYIGPN